MDNPNVPGTLGELDVITEREHNDGNDVVQGVTIEQYLQAVQNEFEQRQQEADRKITELQNTIVALQNSSSPTSSATSEGSLRMSTEIPLLIEQPRPEPVMPYVDRSILLSTAPPRPSFSGDGTDNPIQFLNATIEYAEHMQFNNVQMLNLARECLKGTARHCMDIFRHQWKRFADFKADFIKIYWADSKQMALKQQIATAQWMPEQKQTMLDHFAFYLSESRLLTTVMPDDILMGMLIQHFPSNIQALWTLKLEKSLLDMAEFLAIQDTIWNNPTAKKVTSSAITTAVVPARNGPYHKDNREQQQQQQQNTNRNGQGHRSGNF